MCDPCYKALPDRAILTYDMPIHATVARMLGDGDNACQAAVIRPEDRVGFMDGMLYTA